VDAMRASRRAAATALICACAFLARAQSPTDALVEASGDTVIFKGQINARSVAQFLRLLQDPGIKRLVITSRGGSVAAALDMAIAVHERQLDIEVPTTCWSSCANYVFPAAHRKTLGRPGSVAWHGNMAHVLYLQQTGQASWSESQLRSARDLATREAEFFRRIGVDGFVCWFAKIAPYNVDDFYYLSTEDMARFGIHDVSTRDDAALPDSEQLRQVLVDWAALEAGRPVVNLRE
jgi:hypothetical protein